MGSQAKNNLQICFHASSSRRNERSGGGGDLGGERSGRQASFSSPALIKTFKVNSRSVHVHTKILQFAKKGVSVQTLPPVKLTSRPLSLLSFSRVYTVKQS